MRYLFLLLIISACSSETAQEKQETKNNHLTYVNEPMNIPIYSIVSEDSTYKSCYFEVITPIFYPKDSLVEIAHDLRYKHKWTKKLVVRFHNKVFKRGSFYASAAYLPDCDNCGNIKDAAGDSVQILEFNR